MNKTLICLSCDETYADDDTYCCSNCGELLCPKCGGEVETIENYDRNMRINAKES